MASLNAQAEPTRVQVSIENLVLQRGTFQTPHWVGFHPLYHRQRRRRTAGTRSSMTSPKTTPLAKSAANCC